VTGGGVRHPRTKRPGTRRGVIRVAGPLAGVLLLVLLGAVAAVSQPAAGSGGPAAAGPGPVLPVVGARLVCPDVPAQSADLRTRGEVVSGPAALGGSGTAGGAGSVVPTPVPGAAGAPLDLAGGAAPLGTDPGRPLQLDATGASATGLAAARLTRGTSGAQRGLAWDRCTRARTDAWFVGVSTAAMTTSVVQLANVDATPADVTLRALTRGGPVRSPAVRGLTLAPHSSQDVALTLLVPGDDDWALEVRADRGRVASAVSVARGGIPAQGVDPVPQTAAPAARVVVPGVPGSAAGTVVDGSSYAHVLTVADPGGGDATVSVEVTDGTGRYVPVGLDAVAVPAGSTATVDLDAVLTAGPATVRVSSADGTPVLAGVLLIATAHFGGARDVASLGAADPVTAPVTLPDGLAGTALATTLVLTGYDGRDVGVTLQRSGAGAPAAAQHVTVPAGRTLAVDLTSLLPASTGAGDPGGAPADPLAGAPGPVRITPDPGSPPLWVAADVAELGYNGPLVAALALGGSGAGTTDPVAAPDVAVALGR